MAEFKFIIEYAQAPVDGFRVEASILGRSALHLTLKLDLISSGDYSGYINENGELDKEKIITDIVSGKIKINE